MQEEGRLKQNSQALGTAEHPKCEGMTVAELQQLDVGKINFFNPVYPAAPAKDGEATEDAGIVGDINKNNKNFPDASQTTDEIIRRIQKKAAQ